MSDGNEAWGNEQAPFVAAESQEAAAAAQAAAQSAAQPSGTTAGPAASGYQAAGASGQGAAAGSWGSVGAGYAAPPPPPVGVVGSPSDPNPTAAFWLGLIPGVGAMYNGQVAKGFVHLIVFMILVAIANNVNDIFGLFVAGWIFFMAFEAYHTAKARRDGLPLPNAFGWNDIGERIGLGKNWPFSPGPPSARPAAGTQPNAGAAANQAGWTGVPPAYPAPGTYPVPPAGPAPGANYGSSYAAGYGPTPNWVGYVPPSAFGGVPPVASPAEASAGGGAVPPGQGVPYSPVHAGAPYPAVDLPMRQSRLPVGAIWLIGLGVLFLLGQWTPLLQFSRVWIPSLLLAGLAVFLFARRMGWTGSVLAPQWSGLPTELRVASAIRVPGALLAIAVLNGLHEAWIVRWHSSWPWLLIVVGVLMLVERMALRQAANLSAAASGPANGGL